MSHTLPWQHHFSALGEPFTLDAPPSPLPAPHWVAVNPALGRLLGLPADWHRSDTWLQAMSGNTVLPGSQTRAGVYGGHQFGHWAGRLGDGRAILLGELGGLELQLKGTGRTPFSRMGDGRAVLRSSIREFLACEAMHGLGIPTTRALCVTGSPAPVQRETVETAAVLARAAPSFVRFGHFEFLAWTGQYEAARRLADHLAARCFPTLCPPDATPQQIGANLLQEAVLRSADLVAQWQAVGFCHGVLNTDNMSMLGLTLDYGPFQFLDAYDPGWICNHTDTHGRYAYDQQPDVVLWNLHCLAQAMVPLLEDVQVARAALQSYAPRLHSAYHARMAQKLGSRPGREVPPAVLAPLLQLLQSQRIDYTIFWRQLSHWMHHRQPGDTRVRSLFRDPDAYDAWLPGWLAWLDDPDGPACSARMLGCNPKYVLRNHLAQQAIDGAVQHDFSMLERLQRVLATPFEEHPEDAALAEHPPEWAQWIHNSCSS